MRLCILSLAAVGLLAIPIVAQAQVINGGFETGSTEDGVPSGWTSDAPFDAGIILDNGLFAAANGAPGPHTGSWDVLLGPNTDDWLTQMVSTQTGQQYDVSFWLYDKAGASSNDFSAYWGGTAPVAGELGSQDNGLQLLSLSNTGTFGWTEFTDTVTAPTSSTALTFFGANASIFYGLDDVSVTATNPGPPSGTPEPGGLALTVVSIGAFGIAHVRKRCRQ
jgi:hypothetical protein